MTALYQSKYDSNSVSILLYRELSRISLDSPGQLSNEFLPGVDKLVNQSGQLYEKSPTHRKLGIVLGGNGRPTKPSYELPPARNRIFPIMMRFQIIRGYWRHEVAPSLGQKRQLVTLRIRNDSYTMYHKI